MPKAEKGSVKDVAKRIKAKGLQKLKFYCQMCEKQCRDANGFKCHIQSESHLRQMKIFSENARGILDGYSREFEKVYLDTLRMFHGTVKVDANNVYQQVIRDKAHVHMNATQWATLGDFVQYLGKTGKCKVEPTERGWDLTYIPRDVDQMLREQQAEERKRLELQAEEDLQRRMEEQRKEAAKALEEAGFAKQEATSLEPRKEGEEAIKISMKKSDETKPAKKRKPASRSVFGEDEDEEDTDTMNVKQSNNHLELVGNNKPAKRQRKDRDDLASSTNVPHSQGDNRSDSSTWLYRDIVVRIISREFEKGRYFRRKAWVDRVLESEHGNGVAAGELTLIPDKERPKEKLTFRISQEHLETVVPKQTGKTVRILRGKFRGKKATLIALDKKNYQGDLELRDGTMQEKIDFEWFAEVA